MNTSPRLVAAGNVAPCRFLVIDSSGANVGAQAGADGFAVAISHDGMKGTPGLPGSNDAIHAEAGDPIFAYGIGEICELVAGAGGWSAGDPLKSDSAGRGVTGNASTDVICAFALSDANAGAKGMVYLTGPTGFPQSTGAFTVNSTSASALAVGANGATNPVLKVNANTASVATGITIIGAAAAGGVSVAVISSGTNESLTIDAKGTGTITLAGTSTGGIIVGGATEALTVKAIKVSGTIAVAVPTIADGESDSVAVDLSGMTFAPAVGDLVVAIPLEALPTDALLCGAFISATDTVTVSFSTKEGGSGVTGASKNFKFVIFDLT